MAAVLYHTLAFFSLFSYGLYHLISAIHSHLKPPTTRGGPAASTAGDYAARPYYPLPLPSNRHHLLRHLPLYLAALSLLLSLLHSLVSSSSSSIHYVVSLQSSAAVLLFLFLAISLLIPIPSELIFFLSSLAFALLSLAFSRAAVSYPSSDLQSHSASLSSTISFSSAAFSLALAVRPRLFILELALAGSVALQGLWSLQTGLSLYVEGLIPEGCHLLLDVPDGSTRCDLEEYRVRGFALLDLAFILHAAFLAVLVLVLYGVMDRRGGGIGRRHNGVGSYEALPTSSSTGALSEMDHVQMKAIGKSSAQA